MGEALSEVLASRGRQGEGYSSASDRAWEEEAVAPLLIVGETWLGTASLEAMLAPLGQRVLKAVPWREELAGLLDEGLCCVIIDARHDWSTGLATLYQLRAHAQARHLPLLILGASEEGAEALYGNGLERVDCLTEPLRPALLLARVDALIQSHEREWAMRAALGRAERGEESMRESERKLLTLVGNLPGIVYGCANERRYTMSYTSAGALELTGYSAEDFMEGRISWGELIHSGDAQRVWEAIQEAIESRSRFTLTYRIHTRTGQERWVWERGTAVFGPRGECDVLEGFITDITELQRSRRRQDFLASVSEALARSLDYETTLAHVVERAVPELGDGCALDMLEADGTLHRLAVAHVDPSRAEILRRLAHLPMMRLDASHGPGATLRTGKTQLLPDVPEALLTEFAPDAKSLELLHQLNPTSALMVPLQARGRTLGTLSLIYSRPEHHYDSETVRLAEEVAHRAALAVDNARLYRDAQEAVKLRDEFLSVASHELKTPLTPLNLKLSAVARELQPRSVDPQAQRILRHLELAHRQVKRLSTLINGLLDVSNLSRGELVLHPEEMDLGPLLREVAAGLAPEAARVGTEVRLEVPERVLGRWDRLRLEQIVTHLLSNAIRFGEGRPIQVRLAQEKGQVHLVVHDEGIGIPLEAQERIFGKFERAVSGRYYGGLGLGLYMTRSLLEAMGGSIRVESRPGEGSTFTIELPSS